MTTEYSAKYLPKKIGWYSMIISNYPNNTSTIDIIQNSISIFPKITIPNFLFKDNIVYFHVNNLDDIIIASSVQCDIDIKKCDIPNIDLWHFRRCFDLVFLNYYLKYFSDKVPVDFKKRVAVEFDFMNNPDIDFGFKRIKRKGPRGNGGVLYLISYSMEHKHIGYTIRTHQLMKAVQSKSQCPVYVATQYGYPYNLKLDTYKESNDDFVFEGITYIKLLNGTDNRNNNDIVEYMKKYIGKVVELCLKLGISVVHGITDYINGMVALNVGKILGIKSVYEVRGFWEDNIYKKEIEGSDVLRMKKNAEDYVMKNVSKVITINKYLRDEIVVRSGLNEEDIGIVYNGVDIDLFCPLVRSGNTGGEIIIGYIGSILEYEGIDYILECMKRFNGVKFIVIGEGSHKEELMRLSKGLNVEFLGKVPYEDVIKYYNIFDIVVYPRRNNKVCNTTSSSKVFEAMAMEKAILVSKLDAWTEIIEDGINGLYCVADDVESIYEGIRMLVYNGELRRELGRNARKWVMENRTWERSGEELLGLWF